MATLPSKGRCYFCNGVFAKAAIRNHLKACKARKAAQEAAPGKGGPKGQPAKVFHIAVEGRDRPEYWMHIEVPAVARLEDLDEFLRDVWLECCDHLSAFTIKDTSYQSSPDREWGGRSMNVRLYSVLQSGMKFRHEYDFGSTTELNLRLLSERMGEIRGKPVQVLARNEPPAIMCEVCGKETATKVCSDCSWSGEGWLCSACARQHRCGRDMLSPIANSPRVGVCAYSG